MSLVWGIGSSSVTGGRAVNASGNCGKVTSGSRQLH